jgi:hypothetical protein
MKKHPVIFWLVLAVLAWFGLRLYQTISAAATSVSGAAGSLGSTLPNAIESALGQMQSDVQNAIASISGSTSGPLSLFNWFGSLLSFLANLIGNLLTLNFSAIQGQIQALLAGGLVAASVGNAISTGAGPTSTGAPQTTSSSGTYTYNPQVAAALAAAQASGDENPSGGSYVGSGASSGSTGSAYTNGFSALVGGAGGSTSTTTNSGAYAQ